MLPLAVLLTIASPSAAPGDAAMPDEAASDSADTQRPRGVAVILVGPPGDRAATQEVLSELLGRLEVDLSWEQRDELDVQSVVRSLDVSAAPDRLATVVVDLQTTAGLVIVLDAPGDRILVRRVALDAGVDEIAREEIGAITAEAIDALRAGGTIGVLRREIAPPPEPVRPAPQREPVPRVAPPEVVAPTSTPSPARWPDTLALVATYRIAAWAPAELQHRLGATLVLLDRARTVAPRLELGVGAWVPARVGPDAQGVRVLGATARASAGLDLRLGRATTLVTAVGVGLDALGVRSRADAGARWRAIPILDARIGLSWWLRPGVALDVGPTLVVDLVDVRILAAADDRVLFDPWRVWPGLRLSLGGFVALIDRTPAVPPRT